MLVKSHSWACIQEKKHNSKIYMHPNVHNSAVYNDQDMAAT